MKHVGTLMNLECAWAENAWLNLLHLRPNTKMLDIHLSDSRDFSNLEMKVSLMQGGELCCSPVSSLCASALCSERNWCLFYSAKQHSVHFLFSCYFWSTTSDWHFRESRELPAKANNCCRQHASVVIELKVVWVFSFCD